MPCGHPHSTYQAVGPAGATLAWPLAYPWIRVRLKLEEHHAAWCELPRLLTEVLAVRALISLAIRDAKHPALTPHLDPGLVVNGADILAPADLQLSPLAMVVWVPLAS